MSGLFGPADVRAVPTAYYALHLREFDMQTHCHPRGEIMYTVSGGCRVTVSGEEHRLKGGQFVLLGPDVPHRLRIGEDGACSILNLEYAFEGAGPGASLTGLAQQSRVFRTLYEKGSGPCLVLVDEGGDGEGRVGRALQDLIAELEHRERREPYLVELLFERVMIEISRCPARDARGVGMGYVRKAKVYIEEHLFEEIDVASVAAAAGVNHSYLQTLFSRSEKCGVMAYVNRLRMEHAAFLLVNSNMKVTDIAFQVGFSSRQHFGYTFEKYFHMRPRQYRTLRGRSADTNTGQVQWVLGEDGKYFQYRLTK